MLGLKGIHIPLHLTGTALVVQTLSRLILLSEDGDKEEVEPIRMVGVSVSCYLQINIFTVTVNFAI